MKKLPPIPLPIDRHDIVLDNMGFAVAYGLRIARRRLARDEVESACSLAMVTAAAQFDRSGRIAATGDDGYRHKAYLTYAKFFIRNYVYQCVRDRCVVDVPLAFHLRRHKELENHPRAEELRAAARRAMGACSLDAPGPTTGLPLAWAVAAPDRESGLEPDDVMDLRQRLDGLNLRDRAIVEHRYGVGGREQLTYREIGKKLRIRAEWVQVFERRALAELRKSYRAERSAIAC